MIAGCEDSFKVLNSSKEDTADGIGSVIYVHLEKLPAPAGTSNSSDYTKNGYHIIDRAILYEFERGTINISPGTVVEQILYGADTGITFQNRSLLRADAFQELYAPVVHCKPRITVFAVI